MLDIESQKEIENICRETFEFKKVKELPFILYDGSESLDTDWPSFPYNDTFIDLEKMLLDQLQNPFIHNQLKDFHALNIRCNYGTVIFPSIFGAGYQLMENSMPWSKHLNSHDDIQKIIDNGVPDFNNGLGDKCFETAQFYGEILSEYPKLNKAIKIYHPDLQGAFDIVHLLWGKDIFLALYDCPEMVHQLLNLITKTYIGWMKKWKEFVNEGNEFTTHWSFYIKGGIMLRDDSAIMLSLEHYNEFVKPYDQELLDEFGGCIHYCGKGDAFIESMCESKNLFGIHCSQPEMNNMDMLIESTQSKKITLLGLPEQYLTNNIKSGAILLIRPHI